MQENFESFWESFLYCSGVWLVRLSTILNAILAFPMEDKKVVSKEKIVNIGILCGYYDQKPYFEIFASKS